MFKANNKDNRTTPQNDQTHSNNSSALLTYFTPCSSVSIINFEKVIAGWVLVFRSIEPYLSHSVIVDVKRFSKLFFR